VGIDFKKPEVKKVDFYGKETFLDADILIIDPILIHQLWSNAKKTDRGLYFYSKDGSDSLRGLHKHRSLEIQKLLSTEKLVIVFLRLVKSVIGEILNQDEFDIITNYDWLPFQSQYINEFSHGFGKEIKLIAEKHQFASYYHAFKKDLEYEVYLQNYRPTKTFLTTNTGNSVGWSENYVNGQIIFLPPPPQKEDINKILGVLIHCSTIFFKTHILNFEPSWVKKYTLPGENAYQPQIDQLQQQIDDLIKQKEEIESKKQKLSDYRALLFENGKPLENAVINAFRLMGFQAENLKKDDMEHDVILTSSEGRAIAEVEGKDKTAVNIEKLDQLTRVVDEDFIVNNSYPEGILIGNPYRLLPIEERSDPFTEKVRIAVKRKNFKLLTTVELFKAVIKMLESPTDENYKTECREIFFNISGEEITFP
jgi:hypothetical protein